MPTDQFIEELTDGSPGAVGDLYALQRRVGGVWSDFFIRSENIAGSGIVTADVTIENIVAGGTTTILPQVPGFCYVILDPPIVQVTGNTPTSGVGSFQIGDDGSGAQWLAQFQDTETAPSYILAQGSTGGSLGAGSSDLLLNTDVFNGATVRIRFSYILAEI